ncbi:MAG: hypothetical protein N2380_06355 [bacterium]|nr:hypothetical protein [bacterium]
MKEEELKILKMIGEGKITAEEGAKLLDAIREESARDTGRFLGKRVKISVINKELGRKEVDISVPLSLAKAFLKFGLTSGMTFGGIKLEESGIDLNELQKMIDEGLEGTLIQVDDEREKVEIRVE